MHMHHVLPFRGSQKYPPQTSGLKIHPSVSSTATPKATKTHISTNILAGRSRMFLDRDAGLLPQGAIQVAGPVRR